MTDDKPKPQALLQFLKQERRDTYTMRLDCFNCGARQNKFDIPYGISVKEYNPKCPQCGVTTNVALTP